MYNETSFSAILAKRYLDKVNNYRHIRTVTRSNWIGCWSEINTASIHPLIFPFNPDFPARSIYFPKKTMKKVFTQKHQVNAAVSVTTFAIICKPTK